MADEVTVCDPRKPVERLVGYVHRWMPNDKYGFIRVRGAKELDGSHKQWHFHANSLRGARAAAIAMGLMVEFTPVPISTEGKRDKAIDIEVVG